MVCAVGFHASIPGVAGTGPRSAAMACPPGTLKIDGPVMGRLRKHRSKGRESPCLAQVFLQVHCGCYVSLKQCGLSHDMGTDMTAENDSTESPGTYDDLERAARMIIAPATGGMATVHVMVGDGGLVGASRNSPRKADETCRAGAGCAGDNCRARPRCKTGRLPAARHALCCGGVGSAAVISPARQFRSDRRLVAGGHHRCARRRDFTLCHHALGTAGLSVADWGRLPGGWS